VKCLRTHLRRSRTIRRNRRHCGLAHSDLNDDVDVASYVAQTTLTLCEDPPVLISLLICPFGRHRVPVIFIIGSRSRSYHMWVRETRFLPNGLDQATRILLSICVQRPWLVTLCVPLFYYKLKLSARFRGFDDVRIIIHTCIIFK
jgi:hypothetical protein